MGRLRWTMPMPPSRASAIASRASVTVSIAAETIGISSAIVRVRRVAVRTSFGSTDDSAGRSRTSSKVSPSLPNFASRSSSQSRGRAYQPLPTGLASADRRELLDLDAGGEPRRVAWLEAASADLEGRRRAGSHREPQRLARRPRVEQGGEVLREQQVARADHRDGLDLWRHGAVPAHLSLFAEQRDAARLGRDVDVSRSHLADRVERHEEVGVVLELLADQLLGLVLVLGDELGLG